MGTPGKPPDGLPSPFERKPSGLDEALRKKLKDMPAVPGVDVKEQEKRALLAAEKAKEAMNEEKYEDAITHWDAAIKIDPKEDYYFQRGVCHYHLKEFKEAVADMEKYLAKEKEDVTALTLHGLCLQGLDKMRDAEKDFQRVRELLTKQIDEKEKDKEKDEAWKKSQTERLFSRADMQFLLRDYAAAVADMERAIALQPATGKDRRIVDNLRAGYISLARQLEGQRKFKEAIPVFTKALDLDPGFIDIRFERAKAYLGNTQYTEALKDTETVLGTVPRFMDAQILKAQCLQKLKRMDDAIASMKNVYENPKFFPGFPQAAAELARLYESRGNAGDKDLAIQYHIDAMRKFAEEEDKAPEALASATALVRLWPDHPGLRYTRGNMLRDAEEHREALKEFDAADALFAKPAKDTSPEIRAFLKRNPDMHTHLWMNRAFLRRAEGFTDDSFADFERVMKEGKIPEATKDAMNEIALMRATYHRNKKIYDPKAALALALDLCKPVFIDTGEIVPDLSVPTEYLATLAICYAANEKWDSAIIFINEAIRRSEGDRAKTREYSGLRDKFKKGDPEVVNPEHPYERSMRGWRLTSNIIPEKTRT